MALTTTTTTTTDDDDDDCRYFPVPMALVQCIDAAGNALPFVRSSVCSCARVRSVSDDRCDDLSVVRSWRTDAEAARMGGASRYLIPPRLLCELLILFILRVAVDQCLSGTKQQQINVPLFVLMRRWSSCVCRCVRSRSRYGRCTAASDRIPSGNIDPRSALAFRRNVNYFM
jgi:hypothetical protein